MSLRQSRSPIFVLSPWESAMDNDEDKVKNAAMGVAGKLALVVPFVAVPWAIFTGEDIWTSLAIGLGSAFAVYLLFTILVLPIAAGLDAAEHEDNPLKKLTSFLFVVVGILAFLDGALMQGTFLVMPALSLIGVVSFESTYWGCEGEWVVVDEGSWCES